jgi:hypothetical protein
MHRLRHPTGKKYTEAENRQAILTYLHLKKQTYSGNQKRKSKTELVQELSVILVRGRRLLRRIVSHYEMTNEIYVADGGPRGRGSKKWVYSPLHFSASVIAWMKARIDGALAEGITVRISWLRDELCDRFNLVASRAVISRVLKKCCGAKWGRLGVNKGNFDPNSPESRRLRDNFIRKYVVARRLERDGIAILVYFDESYINIGHHSKMSWHFPGQTLNNKAKGRRLIILHAMTKYGPVVTFDESDKPLNLSKTQNSDLKTPALTAEMIYEAGKADGDYHDNMDSDTYLSWLRMRLLPTLRSLFPGKRFFFILDNAGYHKTRASVDGKPWEAFPGMSKARLAAVMKAWNISSFTCTRWSKAGLMQESKQTTCTFTEAEYLLRAPRGPSAKELVAELQRQQHAHPEYFRTLAEVLLRDESLADSNNLDPLFHQFIFTPPYEGFLVQITEHWWAHFKNYVGLSLERHNTWVLLVRISAVFDCESVCSFV